LGVGVWLRTTAAMYKVGKGMRDEPIHWTLIMNT